MTSYTPRFNIPKPDGSDPIRGNSSDNLRLDMVQSADAVERELGKLTDEKVAVSDPRLPGYSLTENVFVVTDSEDNQSWLGVNPVDLGPSKFSQEVLKDYYGLTAGRDEHSIFSVVFSTKERTDLTLDAEQGILAEFVVKRLAPRIGAYLNLGAGAIGDRVMRDGKLVPAFPDLGNTTIWGSSSAQNLAALFARLFSGEFHNEAKSGERAEQIFARLGSTPAKINAVIIPASGSVAVSSSNMMTNQYLKPYTGTLAGVHGTLSSSASEMTFTRSTSGAAVSVPSGSEFIPEIGSGSRQHVTILDAGKNNVYDTSYDVPDRVNSLFLLAFNYLSPDVKRVAVLTLFVDSTQTPESTSFRNVQAINTWRRETFGDMVYDLDGYILSPQIWVDSGISPTPGDLAQQASGVKPDSLSSDFAHLNAAANAAVTLDFERFLKERGW